MYKLKFGFEKVNVCKSQPITGTCNCRLKLHAQIQICENNFCDTGVEYSLSEDISKSGINVYNYNIIPTVHKSYFSKNNNGKNKQYRQSYKS